MKRSRWLYILLLCVFTWGTPISDSLAADEQKDTNKATPEKQGNAPKIQFDELSFDFGASSQNTELKHSFTFKNVGKGVLLIDKVKAG